VFGGAPNALRQPQNIFESVESSMWHSSPITVSNVSAMTRQAYRSRPSYPVAEALCDHTTRSAGMQRVTAKHLNDSDTHRGRPVS
jgi:hypothetical protein